MQWLGERSHILKVLSSLTVAQIGKWGWVAKPQTSPSIWPCKKLIQFHLLDYKGKIGCLSATCEKTSVYQNKGLVPKLRKGGDSLIMAINEYAAKYQISCSGSNYPINFLE